MSQESMHTITLLILIIFCLYKIRKITLKEINTEKQKKINYIIYKLSNNR